MMKKNDGKLGSKTIPFYNLKRHFTVDGYNKIRSTIHQFQGCYRHGCRNCHPENELKYKTMEQNTYFKSNGYNL